MKYSLLLFGLLIEKVYSAEIIPHPEADENTFVVHEGDGLDQYECGGVEPNGGNTWLHASLFVGEIAPNPESASLMIPAYDVDIPDEVDSVYFNGKLLGMFTGLHNIWNLNTFELDIADIKFNDFNDISIHVDVLNEGWCASVDWIAIAFYYDKVYPQHEDTLVHNSFDCADLKFTVKFPNPTDTECDVQASLYKDGNIVTSVTDRRLVTSNGGVGKVEFLFDNSYIGDIGLVGPFKLQGVLVTCDNGSQYMKPIAHTTPAYTLADYQCSEDIMQGGGAKQTEEPTSSPTSSPTTSTTSSPTTSPTPVGGVRGDPHFKTWDGQLYDYHGICDLVLLHNPEFMNGLGMDIHIRSSRTRQWSYISRAVVKIGDEKFELSTTRDRMNFSIEYFVNGISGKDDNPLKKDNMKLPNTISGYDIQYRSVNSQQKEYVFNLGEGETLSLHTWKHMIRIDLQGCKAENFGSSVGLMGTFTHSYKVGRDNSTIIEDLDKFGQEWQVRPDEPMLFTTVEGPQAPSKCEIPSKTQLRRRLSESEVTVEEAKLACATITNKDDFDMCVFDVIATGDADGVGVY